MGVFLFCGVVCEIIFVAVSALFCLDSDFLPHSTLHTFRKHTGLKNHPRNAAETILSREHKSVSSPRVTK